MNRIQLATAASLLVAGSAFATDTTFTNAIVHSMGEAGTYAGGLVVRDGKIHQLIPSDTNAARGNVVNAAGKMITPGIFAPLSALGVVEIGAVGGTNDDVADGKTLNAAFDIAPAINPNSTLFPISRIEGVTRAMVAPSSPSAWRATVPGHVLAGQGAVIQLAGGANTVTQARAAMFVTLGEHGADFGDDSRAGALLRLRSALDDAKRWAALPSSQKQVMQGEFTINRASRNALGPALKGEQPVVVRVHRASDIRAVMALAEDYGLTVIIAGGDEAWMVADELAAADIGVILDPTSNLPASFESLGARSDAAAILHSAGVLIAFADENTHNVRNLRQLAGNAVAHGLPWNAALAAITVNPAQMFGASDSVGSLMPGHAADVVVWSGDPLEVTTMAEAVYINGKAVPNTSRQTLLRDRYMGFLGLPASGDSDDDKKADRRLPPAYR